MIIIKINYASTLPNVNITYDNTNVYTKVVYGSGGGGAATWGLINGDIYDQTDLQAEFDLKVPYTGATTNVNLGEYELKAGQMTLDTSPTGTAAVATTRWNDSQGISETTLKGGSVILKNGVDLVARIVNKVSPNTTLTKAGYQAVRVSGAQGQRLAVALAQANNDNNSADTIGLVTETIPTNQEGFIMTVGQLEGINTTGSLQGETWNDGDVLYLSPTTAGALTNVKPVAPQHIIVIGYVEYAHVNNGKIYVKVMNGWELGELHDVNTIGATNGQVLAYNSTLGIWQPTTNGSGTVSSVAVSGGTGISVSGSPITSSGTITVTNSAPDQVVSLTGAGTTSISGTYPSFTITSNDQYVGTVTSVGLTSTTSGLTIGSSPITTSGNITLDIATASGSANGLLSSTDWTTFNNKQNALTNPITGTGTSGQVAYWSGTNTQTGSNNLFWDATNNRLGIGTNAPTYKLDISGISNGAIGAKISATTGLLNIYPYASSSYGVILESRNITNTAYNPLSLSGSIFYITDGNVLINTFTNSGQRLQVQGDAFIKGSGNTSGTTALTVQNSNGTGLFSVRNDGLVLLNDILSLSTTITVYGLNGAVTGINLRGSSSNTFTSGTRLNVRVTDTFSPTSGTGINNLLYIDPTINQTGGANGITRGLYIQPTLTAAADWRSIEWSNNSGWGLYGAGTANNYIAGDTYIGTTTTSATKLTISGSETAASALARGVNVSTTLVAAANNDVLVGLDVNPTFTNGAFTGITNFVARFQGTTITTGQIYIGTGPNGGMVINGGSSATGKTIQSYGGHPLIINSIGNNVLIGTTTDAGYRLDVNGTARVQNNTTITMSKNNTTGVLEVINTISTNPNSNNINVFAPNMPNASSMGIIYGGKANSTRNGFGINWNHVSDASTSNYTSFNFFGVDSIIRLYGTGNTTIGGYTSDDGFKLDINGTTRVQSKLSLSAGTTSNAQINLASSTAPTSPNNGDIWFDGTDIKMRIGGVTKTFTLV